ncbi:MAG TPA: hypothetical protein PK358_10885 [Spirochaetota bacterium]|nr:hypothetical protein [Spirochaetota bacterium]HPJ35332.1 hypothetical protein [Spirochaetota bacterium]
MKKLLFYIMFFVLTFYGFARAEFLTSFQGAYVYSSYNDVKLPGDSGTKLSYTDDLHCDPVLSPRIEAGYEFEFPVYIGVMASLLRLEASGQLDKTVYYDGLVFNAGSEVKAKYRFDSYRITGRYYFIDTESFKIGAGFTGKIRDAEITLEEGDKKGGLKNRGAVPLLNFYAEWKVSEKISLLFYGDGAWSPYGRAEDFFAGGLFRFNETAAVMAGYRMLEGGADNDEVYTFAMFHYAVLGVELRF